MRKNINLLLSGVLSIGVSSVFGSESLTHERESAVGGATHIAQVFNTFATTLHTKFGVSFPSDNSRGEVVRFKKGLIAHLDKMCRLESSIRKRYEENLEEGEKGTDNLFEMLKAITAFGGFAEGGEHVDDAAASVYSDTDDDFGDLKQPRTKLVIQRELHRVTVELERIAAQRQALEEESTVTDPAPISDMIRAKQARLEECSGIAALGKFRERGHGEQKVEYEGKRVEHTTKVNNAASEIDIIHGEIRLLRPTLNGLERMHAKKTKELGAVAARETALTEHVRRLQAELADLDRAADHE